MCKVLWSAIIGIAEHTHSLGEDGHLDAVVGPLLPEGEHLLLGVVEEGGGARPAAVVKVCYHADLAPDAHINTFYINSVMYFFCKKVTNFSD